ncbi:hypothetical protein MOB49_12010 [Bacillus haynesii]|uniref:hypothetical protein n=1 Tax=Bacillus TaxID=1386 RepID=UPI00092714DB|nr:MULTISPECIES: hypothetical protein [Bacillus]MCY7967816.1 hypothetical protein [Bacillus haynesii]MCY8102388.1 hypothetical protein [Bacillus haynesii]MCY8664991.1 hypothetical protein [Bacillus haynesii]MEC1348012.1 hypothetical protein [Bacillus haynesii]MEC1429028.1 hypothetical protein [Bacillus sonorensis]
MEQDIIKLITYGIRFVQGVAGAYAAFKIGAYAIGYMSKNQRKIEEAKDGMKNVAIGVVIVAGCEAAVQWLQKGIHF